MITYQECDYLAKKIAKQLSVCDITLEETHRELIKWTIKTESDYYNDYGVKQTN